MSNVIPYFVLAVVALGFLPFVTPFLIVMIVKAKLKMSTMIALLLSLMVNIIEKSPLMNLG